MPARIAKTRARRVVQISANLSDWLAQWVQSKPAIRPRNWRHDFEALRANAELGTGNAERRVWVQDILRHTAISNHLALHQHEGQTAHWAGNSPDMVHKHYKGLVSAAAAKRFWEIVPTRNAEAGTRNESTADGRG